MNSFLFPIQPPLESEVPIIDKDIKEFSDEIRLSIHYKKTVNTIPISKFTNPLCT